MMPTSTTLELGHVHLPARRMEAVGFKSILAKAGDKCGGKQSSKTEIAQRSEKAWVFLDKNAPRRKAEIDGLDWQAM